MAIRGNAAATDAHNQWGHIDQPKSRPGMTGVGGTNNARARALVAHGNNAPPTGSNPNQKMAAILSMLRKKNPPSFFRLSLFLTSSSNHSTVATV